jgi:hypothetical protein
MDIESLLVDFYNGLHILGLIAAGSEAGADPHAAAAA